MDLDDRWGYWVYQTGYAGHLPIYATHDSDHKFERTDMAVASPSFQASTCSCIPISETGWCADWMYGVQSDGDGDALHFGNTGRMAGLNTPFSEVYDAS
jgi:hypothetical protein